MTLPFRTGRPRQSVAGVLVAPLIIGVASAVAHFLVQRPGYDYISWQGPLVFHALAGVAIAFSCRPALARIPWSRSVAVALALALLAGIGNPGDWAMAWVLEGLGLPRSGAGLLTAALVAGVLMGLLYRPQGGGLDGADLWRRFRFHPWPRQAGRLALLAALAACLWLAVSWVDAWLEEGARTLYIPLLEPLEPNSWLRLQGVWDRSRGLSGAPGVLTGLFMLWLRSLLRILPLLPIALAVRGSRGQLTLVFTILLFVIGEFAQLLRDPTFVSLNWLLARTAMGLGRSALVGLGMVLLFGVVRGRGQGTAQDAEPPA